MMKLITILSLLPIFCFGQKFSSSQISSAIILRSYEPEYQAYLNKIDALGYTLPSVGQRIKQNTLCTCLKINVGKLTDNFDGGYIFAQDGSSDAASVNLIYPNSFQATYVNSPTWTSNQGISGDGATSYVNINYAWGTNGIVYTQNSAHRAAWMYAVSGTGMPVDGTTTSTLNRMVIASSGTNAINSNTTGITGVSLNGTGFKAINRTSSSSVTTYRNAIKQTFSSTSSSTNSTASQLLLRTSGNFATHTISLYFWGKSITDSQASNMYTCFQQYMNSL